MRKFTGRAASPFVWIFLLTSRRACQTQTCVNVCLFSFLFLRQIKIKPRRSNMWPWITDFKGRLWTNPTLYLWNSNWHAASKTKYIWQAPNDPHVEWKFRRWNYLKLHKRTLAAHTYSWMTHFPFSLSLCFLPFLEDDAPFLKTMWL